MTGAVEKYAAQMPGGRLDGKPLLPEGIDDWSALYAAVSMDMALAMYAYGIPCEASTYVVRADGPLPRNAVEVTPETVFSARDGFEVGRGEITEYGVRFQLRGQWIERLGMQPMGLVRCQSAP